MSFRWLWMDSFIISRSILLPSPSPGVTASQCSTCPVLMDIRVMRCTWGHYKNPGFLTGGHFQDMTSFPVPVFPPPASSPFPAHVKLQDPVWWCFSDGFCEWLTVFARRTGQLQHPEGPVIGLFVIFCLTFSQATRKWRRLTTSLVWDHDLFLYSEDRQNL